MPLCLCTIGLAIIGYLGYRAVRHLIICCQKTEKTNQIAQKNIQQRFASQTPEPIVSRVSKLDIDPGKITMGHGEYIVFHKLSNGKNEPLSVETFDKVYDVLLRYSPPSLVNSDSEKGMERCANRYTLIKNKIKKIDSTLEAIFIPRTLYELVFIRKCIQEDLKNKRICPDLDPYKHRPSLSDFNNEAEREAFCEQQLAARIKRKCWHMCHFTDEGDNRHAGVKNVAYRLNQVMLKAFKPQNEGFSKQELSIFAEKEIQFLKTHYQNGRAIMEKMKKGERVDFVGSISTSNPTTNFGFESERGSTKPMGVRGERDAQIIRNAIALECSAVAKHSVFLYRGADFEKEAVSHRADKDTPYSLSYGASLFAGCVYDGDATAFYYMRKSKNAYAIPVSFRELNNSAFFIPKTHAVAQIFGHGEIFHARTKAWKDFDVKKMGGINYGINKNVRQHLRSNLSQEELCAQFEAHKKKAFQLKPGLL